MKIKLKLNLNFSVPHCYQVQFKILIFNTFDISIFQIKLKMKINGIIVMNMSFKSKISK